jgi:hypothetical protein
MRIERDRERDVRRREERGSKGGREGKGESRSLLPREGRERCGRGRERERKRRGECERVVL